MVVSIIKLDFVYVSALTVIPRKRWRGYDGGRLGQVHAAVFLEADSLHFAPRLPEQDPSLIPQAHGCPVEVGVLGIVLHAVGDDEVEVILKLLQGAVALGVDALPHAGEVHWVLDVVQVVWHLQGERTQHNTLD